ncbi:MAG TPA: hypothetical protein VLV78_10740 [Thermoanaerobaculia bacterium]|nr:hypothetical protein [Thermoanaerobaculia bacterium]
MDQKQRKTARGHRDQLLTLVNGWDPARLLQAGAPRHEYGPLVDKLLDLLSRNASKEEVAGMLDREIREHFGKTAEGSAQFAVKAVTWYQTLASES